MSDEIFMGQPSQTAVEWFRRNYTEKYDGKYTKIVMTDGGVYILDLNGTVAYDTECNVVKTISGTERSYFDFGGDDGGRTYGPHGGDRIKIKEIYFGTNVTGIGRSLFMDHNEHGYDIDNTVLQKVYIPDSVTSIGQQAFCQCVMLEEIVIPDYVETLDYTCAGSTGLKKVVIGRRVQTIRLHAFSGCTSLNSLTFRDYAVETGEYCFENDYNLKTIIFEYGHSYASQMIVQNHILCIADSIHPTIEFNAVCTDGEYTIVETHSIVSGYDNWSYSGTLFS